MVGASCTASSQPGVVAQLMSSAVGTAAAMPAWELALCPQMRRSRRRAGIDAEDTEAEVYIDLKGECRRGEGWPL